MEQSSLFGDPGDRRQASVKREPEPRIETVDQVYELAREVMGLEESEDDPPLVRARRQLPKSVRARASRLGLTAQWAPFDVAKGYIRILDPTTGEEVDLPYKAAPGWARREAQRRADLYRAGDRRAYELTAAQLEEIYEAEVEAAGLDEREEFQDSA